MPSRAATALNGEGRIPAAQATRKIRHLAHLHWRVPCSATALMGVDQADADPVFDRFTEFIDALRHIKCRTTDSMPWPRKNTEMSCEWRSDGESLGSKKAIRQAFFIILIRMARWDACWRASFAKFARVNCGKVVKFTLLFDISQGCHTPDTRYSKACSPSSTSILSRNRAPWAGARSFFGEALRLIR